MMPSYEKTETPCPAGNDVPVGLKRKKLSVPYVRMLTSGKQKPRERTRCASPPTMESSKTSSGLMKILFKDEEAGSFFCQMSGLTSSCCVS